MQRRQCVLQQPSALNFMVMLFILRKWGVFARYWNVLLCFEDTPCSRKLVYLSLSKSCTLNSTQPINGNIYLLSLEECSSLIFHIAYPIFWAPIIHHIVSTLLFLITNILKLFSDQYCILLTIWLASSNDILLCKPLIKLFQTPKDIQFYNLWEI